MMSDEHKKLTFSEYVASKGTLREAIQTTPQRVVEYRVRKYCKLTVGFSKEDRDHVPLKPNNKVLVEWLYVDPNNPTPLNLRFEGPEAHEATNHVANWSGERLLKWLTKNTSEKT